MDIAVNRVHRAVATRVLVAVVAWAWLPTPGTAAGAEGAPAAVAERDIRLQQEEPSLRLDLPGHTGDVLALAFFADGTRLVSGGRDKVALVWKLLDQPAPAPTDGVTGALERDRRRERAFRWQVRRATRGAIQTLAVSTDDDSIVAIAGNGAMGSTGEIVLVRAADGSHVKTLGGGDRDGHRQAVNAIEFTTDGSWLVSRDLDGRVFAWERGNDWQPFEVAPEEKRVHGDAVALALRRYSQRPVVALGKGALAFATLVNAGERAANPEQWIPRWRIRTVDLTAPGRPGRDLGGDHLGSVTALAATPDGGWLVSAALDGTVAVVRPADGAAKPSWKIDDRGYATALAFAPDGGRLAVGVESGAGRRVEVWEVDPARRLVARPTVGRPTAVRVSRDGKWIAWTGGAAHEVFVEPWATMVAGGEARPLVLGGVGTTITAVAFDRPGARPPQPEPTARDIKRKSLQEGQRLVPAPRRLAVSTRAVGADVAPTWERAFDVEALAPIPVGAPAAWAPPAGIPAGWSIVRAPLPPPGVERWQLERGGAAAGIVDLQIEWQGRAAPATAAVSWLTRPGQAEPWAVALGTDRGIGVYQVNPEPGRACRLVRWFRGHEDLVTALAVSGDGAWLASGGRDGLIMLWSLQGVEREGAPLRDRWGVDLAVEGGRLVVKTVEPAGPLAGRDVRPGDTIDRVSWATGRNLDNKDPPVEHVEPAAVLEGLATVPFSQQVFFTTSRAGAAQDPFQRLPAWENVAALHMTADGEWAFWTPRGYYSASANGDALFGWLVNRGLDRLPHFYRAQHFRRRLERSDVMRRLLLEGSLDAALRATRRDVPESTAIALPRAVAAAPRVRIVSPRPGAVAEGPTIDVEAEVEIPAGVEVNRVRAYASGAVTAQEPRVVEERPAVAGAPRIRRYRWEGVRLPADSRHLVQVFAGTNQGSTDLAGVEIAASHADSTAARGRVFVLCFGVDRYPQGRDGDLFAIPDLLYSVADARSVYERLTGDTRPLVAVGDRRLLADEAVTRRGFRDTARRMADACRAADVGPDDLLVIFMAGHGLINGGEQPEYVFLCHDFDGKAVKDDGVGAPVVRRDDVIAWDDFADLERLPCRKLALVDSCHSGGLGRESRGDSIRDFQENVIVVVAAAADDQSSWESDVWQHGAFTKSLLDALEGSADGRPGDAADGVVSLHEVIDYTLENVPRLAEGVQDRGPGTVIRAQTPTVSPKALVPYVRLPLVRVTAARPEVGP